MSHNFDSDIKYAGSQADAPWWPIVYKKAFGEIASITSITKDGWAQRAGIDKIITLACGKIISIDEKVRRKDYPDFFLEYWSDEQRRVKGWIAKDLACDFIAYAFEPSQTCYLLPFLLLRRAWKKHHRRWLDEFGPPRCKTSTRSSGTPWTTVGLCVPITEVINSITDSITITWDPT